jgi:hypothetical protein
MVHASTTKRLSREHGRLNYGLEGMRDNNLKFRAGRLSYLLA